MAATKPRLGVFKFTSCDGCQLTLLDCEEWLLDAAGAFDIAYFPEALTATDVGRYDVALVEGSISTTEEAIAIHRIRARCDTLVTIGACATAGGIQALRNAGRAEAFAAMVYPDPSLIDALKASTPIADHVAVDHELRGCPIDKMQLFELLSALLAGRRPQTPAHSTCIECKMAGRVCVLVAKGLPCLGPVTHAGCGALCPGFARGCFGCFGPKETPNTGSVAQITRDTGASAAEVSRLFSTFTAGAPAFRSEAEAHGDQTDQG